MKPWRGLKKLTKMVFARATSWGFFLPRTRIDYAAEVGDGMGSSTVMAPLLWAARTFPEAPPALWRQRDDGQEDLVRDHPVLRLLQRPNPFFTGPLLWIATITEWLAHGEAYWLKMRNGTGTVSELWWSPHWMIEPKGDDDAFITHYEYRPNGAAVPFLIDPANVVHFRFGADPDNPRRGYSPLKSVLREVFTDDEAAAFTASLLRNMGVPGLVVSPEGNGPPPGSDDVDAVKGYMKTAFTGDRRGEPLVMSGPTKVHQFGFSPEQLLLKDLRRIPEERVTAVLGVPAMVAGLGAGLDRSTFTNYGEAREAAYEQTIIPSQRILAEDVRFQLFHEFVSSEELWTWVFGFDLSKVRVLQEDVVRTWRRYDVGVRGGWVTVATAKRGVGLKVEEGDHVYLRQSNLVQVDERGTVQSLAQPTNGNGNSRGAHGADPREIAAEVVREMVAAGVTQEAP